MHLGKARNVLLYRDDCIIDTPILFHFPYGKNLCEVDMKQVETYILSFNEMAPILMRERDVLGVNNRMCKKIKFYTLKRGQGTGAVG